MALLTLADAKLQLNKTSTTDDTELTFYVAATVKVIERLAGAVDPRAVTEVVRQRGGGRVLTLSTRPVMSVTSATSIDGSSTLDVASLYVASPMAGMVRRTDEGPISGGPWSVVYQAGRASVPEHIGLAARILVAHLWETQRAGPISPPRLTPDFSDAIPGTWFAIPDKVRQLLDGESAPLVAY